MARSKRLAAILFFLLTGVQVNELSSQESQSLSLTIHPTTVSLARGEREQVLIVAKNGTERIAESLTLGFVERKGIKISAIEPFVEKLLPANSHSWIVEVERTADDVTGEFNFHVSSILKPQPSSSDENAAVLTDISTVKLSIAQDTLTDIDNILELTLDATAESVEDYRPANLALAIKNKSEYVVRITSVSVSHPAPSRRLKNAQTNKPEVQVVPIKELAQGLLLPHQKQILIYRVSSPGRRNPGSRLVALKVDFEWEEHGLTRTGSTIVTQKFSLGIFGESILLQAMSVPTFFLLPGFLLITAFAAALRLLGPTLSEQSKLTKPEIFALAVLLSIPCIYVYNWFVKVNLLNGYKLSDVLWLWFWSLAVGGLLGTIPHVFIRLRKLIASAYKFKTQDSALEIIRKLEIKGMSLSRERAQIVENGIQYQVLRLDDQNPGWVCPQIKFRFAASAGTEFREQFETDFDQAMRADKGVHWLLKTATERGNIELFFDRKSTPSLSTSTAQTGKSPIVYLG